MAAHSTKQYGRRLMPVILDQLADTDPTRVYMSIPKTPDVKDGFLDVTFADFARCVDFTARWIEERFGRSHEFGTITYAGLSDPRGSVLFFAAIKTGYKLLLVSPRNPPATNASLMAQVGSRVLVYAAELGPLIEPVRGILPSSHHVEAASSFRDMLQSSPEHYPYEKDFDEAKGDPILVLHSSGSTGPPKPVFYTHGAFAAHDLEHTLPAPTGRKKKDVSVFEFDTEARVYVVFPVFHLGGFLFHTFHCIFNDVTLVIGPPHLPPDARLLLEIAQQQHLRGICAVPTIMEQVMKEPDGIKFFKNLDFVVVGGAPLPSALGDQLAPVVRLVEFYGTSEIFLMPELFTDSEDFLYHEFNPNLQFEMEPYDPEHGTFELVLSAEEATAPVHHTLPGIGVYHTRDLFTRHPQKPTLYKYFGRRDDIIVLANSEKLNPIPLELNLQGHANLKGVLLIGNRRNQTVLLVEPKEPLEEMERLEFLQTLWPEIEKANSHVAGHGRVARDKVICTTPDKPFLRTGKNTIVRKLTEEAYADEIEELYSDTAQGERLADVSLKPIVKTVYEPSAIVSFLRQIFSISYPQGAIIGEYEDFYSYGLDSLQTLEITANLKRSLQKQTSEPTAWITARTIFQHPTLADLSRLLAAFLSEGVVPGEGSLAHTTRTIDETVARHVQSLRLTTRTTSSQAHSSRSASTVAILGSTGYVGGYTVAALLGNPDISRIYCLNRAIDAEEKQKKFLLNLDKALEHFFAKLIYIKIEIGKPRLGLDSPQYERISREVGVIVYNSWKLDFGIAMRSFEPFLKAVCGLVELSAEFETRMHVVFISSLASVGSLAMGGLAPEAPVEDSLAAVNIGYGQSKLAAERILIAANRQYGIPVSIVRVGQVGGPTQAAGGLWADQPWISAIARTSKALGAIPTPLGAVDWVPVDTIATMLQSFIQRPAEKDVQVYNIVADNAPSWDLFVDALRESLGIYRVIPFKEWVKKLQDISDPSPEDAAKLPALKMLDFYKAMSNASEPGKYATGHARAVSNVEMPGLDKDLLLYWLQGWEL